MFWRRQFGLNHPRTLRYGNTAAAEFTTEENEEEEEGKCVKSWLTLRSPESRGEEDSLSLLHKPVETGQ